ncbi:hypothetical protein SANTM175S_00207 [Streptomyces antimycoticus]
MTLVWAVLMALFACAFSTSTGNVYLTGLTIAGYTYGALLGAFLLGRIVRRANEVDAVIAFLVTVGVMTYIVRGVKIDVSVARTARAHRDRRAMARPHRRGHHPDRGRCDQSVPPGARECRHTRRKTTAAKPITRRRPSVGDEARSHPVRGSHSPAPLCFSDTFGDTMHQSQPTASPRPTTWQEASCV